MGLELGAVRLDKTAERVLVTALRSLEQLFAERSILSGESSSPYQGRRVRRARVIAPMSLGAGAGLDGRA